jgi:hypothetical protein
MTPIAHIAEIITAVDPDIFLSVFIAVGDTQQ